jgi:hypothetical protein
MTDTQARPQPQIRQTPAGGYEVISSGPNGAWTHIPPALNPIIEAHLARPSSPAPIQGLSDRATKILAGGKLNLPHPRDKSKRVVGFVVEAEVAGLSDALFALDEIKAAALSSPLQGREGEIERERERLAVECEAEAMTTSNVQIRGGFILAARLIRRGRRLTGAERLENLKAFLAEDADDEAALSPQAVEAVPVGPITDENYKAAVEQLSKLADAIAAYEEARFPIEPPTAEEAAAFRAEQAGGWRDMSTLPAEGLVLLGVAPDEGFPEGRVMIWNAATWRRGQNERTPQHLQYPADGWMPVPTAPEAGK